MTWVKHMVSHEKFKGLVEHGVVIPVSSSEFVPNCGVELYSDKGSMINVIYDPVLKGLRKLDGHNPIFSSIPNRDLLLYNDMLLNDNINTIIVDGLFGTGKTSTLCSHMVKGLMKTLRGDKGIKKAYISKPHEKLGNSHGHLPGDLRDKTEEEFNSFYQYFDRYGQYGLHDRLQSGKEGLLEVLVFEYLRGRDIDEGWVVLDEAQNTSVKEMTSFISRVGDGAKLIIIGDTSPAQIDKKGNTSENNGLTFVKNAYRGKNYAGCIEMRTRNHILRGQRVKDLCSALIS